MKVLPDIPLQKKGSKPLSLDEIEKEFKKVDVKIDLSGETSEQKELKARWPMMGVGA